MDQYTRARIVMWSIKKMDSASKMKIAPVLCLLLWTCACAQTPIKPAPRQGEPIGPHMRSMAKLKGINLKEPFEPWSPNVYYPDVREAGAHDHHAHDHSHAAHAKKDAKTLSKNPTVGSPVGAGAWLLFRFYKETFSRLDGNRCGFVPSCSRFGYRAVRDHGLHGVVLTFARLMRNHAERDFYRHHHRGYLLDPVSNYTFFSDTLRLDIFHQHKDPAHAWYLHIEATKHLQHPKPTSK